jgi:hypothetical protein
MRRPLAPVPVVVAVCGLVAPADVSLVLRDLGEYRVLPASAGAVGGRPRLPRASAHVPSVPDALVKGS